MPSNKFYVVDEDALTGELIDLHKDPTRKKVVIIEVEPDNIAEADGIVANYTQDDYMAGTSKVEVSGQTTADIRLPKSLFQ